MHWVAHAGKVKDVKEECLRKLGQGQSITHLICTKPVDRALYQAEYINQSACRVIITYQLDTSALWHLAPLLYTNQPIKVR